MLSKIPISASTLSLPKIIACFSSIFFKAKKLEFEKAIAEQYRSEHVFMLNSGLASFYLILASLKESAEQDQDEVIIPAYTAGSLVVAIKKAGLIPVLCDISPENFNMDIDSLPKIVSRKTLCIAAVHMFGIPLNRIKELKSKFPGITIVEDVCQAMGGRIAAEALGTLGDVGFFSFNRGKNISAYGGGCIITNNDIIAAKIAAKIKELKTPDTSQAFKIFLKLLALALVLKPLLYGLLYPWISRFKETAPPKDVVIEGFLPVQAAVGLWMLKDMSIWSEKRYNNAMNLIKGLKDMQQLILPNVEKNSCAAFNRLPIVFRDLKKRQRVEQAMEKAGIETSRMYLKPLHHMFELDYPWGNFPNAVFMAGHLLTLPVHPLLSDKMIKRMIEIIKNA